MDPIEFGTLMENMSRSVQRRLAVQRRNRTTAADVEAFVRAEIDNTYGIGGDHVTLVPDARPFDVDLALRLSRIVHDACPDAPHDIGIRLAQEVASPWISVAERLPEDGRKVLAHYAAHRDADFAVAVYRLRGWRWADDETYPLRDVTHWMSFPTPPGA